MQESEFPPIEIYQAELQMKLRKVNMARAAELCAVLKTPKFHDEFFRYIDTPSPEALRVYNTYPSLCEIVRNIVSLKGDVDLPFFNELVTTNFVCAMRDTDEWTELRDELLFNNAEVTPRKIYDAQEHIEEKSTLCELRAITALAAGYKELPGVVFKERFVLMLIHELEELNEPVPKSLKLLYTHKESVTFEAWGKLGLLDHTPHDIAFIAHQGITHALQVGREKSIDKNIAEGADPRLARGIAENKTAEDSARANRIMEGVLADTQAKERAEIKALLAEFPDPRVIIDILFDFQNDKMPI